MASDAAPPSPPRPASRIRTTVGRWGGLLLSPRRCSATLDPSEGHHDGLILGGLYLAGAELDQLIAAAAGFVAVGAWSSILMFASVLARVLIVPVLALVAAELVLGRPRAYRRAVVLLPLLLGATVVHGLAQVGVHAPGPAVLYDLVFAAVGLGWVAWVRGHVEPEPQKEAERTPGRAQTTASLFAGFSLISLVSVVAAQDVALGRARWSTLGPLPPGQPLPRFELATLDGQSLPSSSFTGEVTVLAFWTTWCPACRSELEQLDALDEDFPEVRFLAVNLEASALGRDAAAGVVREYERAHVSTLPMALDAGAAAAALRIGPIPHMVLLDRDGQIRRVHQGRVRTAVIRSELELLVAAR